MSEAGWGRIVNLSSVSALGNRGQANYSAAKAGLQGFTKTLALELGNFGITANAIAPGFIATEMTAATADRLGVSFEDFKAANAEQIPVRPCWRARRHRERGGVLRWPWRWIRLGASALCRRRPNRLTRFGTTSTAGSLEGPPTHNLSSTLRPPNSMAMKTPSPVTAVMRIAMAATCGYCPLVQRSYSLVPMTWVVGERTSSDAANS